MDPTLTLSSGTLTLAGIVLITIVTIELGGIYLLRVTSGTAELTEFQRAFARAGHGHAGMLVTLGLVAAMLADATTLDGLWLWLARSGVAVSAVLMSAGFFLASAGRDVHEPNRLVAVLWAGGGLLAISVVTLGVGLLRV